MKGAERWWGWVFVAPAALLIGLFIYWPAANMAYTSVHYRDLTDSAAEEYAGTTNYEAVWEDPDFRQATLNTAIFTLLVVPLQTAAALALAVWVDRRGWANRFLRLAVFIPTTISLAVLAVLWSLLYRPATQTGAGLLNGLLLSAGLQTQPFLSSPSQALVCIAAMSIWQGVGFQMLIFLAGLQNIPDTLYEAARIDGARRWRQFWHVTLPGVAPTAVFVVMITTIFALKLFVQPHLMTDGGPRRATLSLVQYTYKMAFENRDLALACTAGVFFFAAVATIAVLQRWASHRAEAMS